LDAAFAALGERPWNAIRMAEVAAAAGVSRQTLYNEFASKQGLARALLRRETGSYLTGVERALALAERDGGDAGECFAAVAGWTLRSVRRSPLLRSALVGSRGEPTPLPDLPRPRGAPRPPAAPAPTDLVNALHACSVAGLVRAFPRRRPEDIAWACEAAIRLTLSYVIAPTTSDEAACLRVAQLLRCLLR
jgi:AcrR family transcriptional regulator